MRSTDQSTRLRFSTFNRSSFLSVSKAIMFVLGLAVLVGATDAKATTYTPTTFTHLARFGGTADCSAADGLNITADDNNDIAPNSQANCTASGFAPSGTVTTVVMHLTFSWFVTSGSPGNASLSASINGTQVFFSSNGSGSASITVPIGTDLSTVSVHCSGDAGRVGFGGVAEVSATSIKIQ